MWLLRRPTGIRQQNSNITSYCNIPNLPSQRGTPNSPTRRASQPYEARLIDLLGVPSEAIRLGLSEADTTKTEAPAEKRRLLLFMGLMGLMGFIGLMGAIKLLTFNF